MSISPENKPSWIVTEHRFIVEEYVTPEEARVRLDEIQKKLVNPLDVARVYHLNGFLYNPVALRITCPTPDGRGRMVYLPRIDENYEVVHVGEDMVYEHVKTVPTNP